MFDILFGFLQEAFAFAIAWGSFLAVLIAAVVAFGLVLLGTIWCGIVVIDKAWNFFWGYKWVLWILAAISTMADLVSGNVRLLLPPTMRTIKAIAQWGSLAILSTFGPWAFVIFVVLGGLNRRSLVFATGGVILALPICLIAWQIIQRLDKKVPKWSELPAVCYVAVCWVSAFLVGFPIIMASD